MTEHDCCGFKFSFEEVDDGFKVHIKGNKELLRPKIEAFEAWLNYQKKARAAGWHPREGSWHSFMYGSPLAHGFHDMYGQGQEKIKRVMGSFKRAFKEAMNEMKDDKQGGINK